MAYGRGGGDPGKMGGGVDLYSSAAPAAELAGTPTYPAPGVSISIIILADV